MIEKISTVILSPQERLKKLLAMYLGELSDFDLLDDCSDLSETYNIVSSLSKAVLIVDLVTLSDKYFDFISRVTSDCPNCRVVAIFENPTIEAIVRIMRAGAKEVLSSPVIKTEFVDVLQKFKEQLNDDSKKVNRCRMISVFSNKGGIGKTSIASNLALELAKTTKENVALIDLNFQLGDITTFMDLKPSFNISYMLKNLDKLNSDFMLSTLEKYKDTSLYVLADPPYFKQAEDISPKQIIKLFEILKETFSYIVVDTDNTFDGKTITALDNSDMIFLVSIVNLPALRNCQRCLDLFSKLGYDDEKVQIVINRYMENDEIKAEDVEKLLNKEIYWKIPNNYFALMAAINKGILLSEMNASSNVAKSYRELAIHVADTIHRQKLIKKIISNSLDNLNNILRG